ncbi:tRNA (adenosine(37)-N6)-threonylcarbamoyltransferase complex dimerization subunit type 1 TsaB [Flavobacterium lacisediminis]|uniref:tRNA (Adenosine(37)-N6)-threonylcarbamoyltransferase complex dimerization subunit type 1 TsaB n=1 Tax=Flavobacterium lacisediminis TaxID=2989705 RepID=A0ABT3EF15_9FLAO|nr:tRNA (adenosine(37)-N6)-threonylcarbamoyltransferase complex dimerization subunit type 1 TsaB [Flavobacterium lacisediminis]MCW1147169.1 tRNA (adenosine(37)-N6)-threonylcarbamoyltransferase complex dimerization subunit type 1 TsaB [Flavobacterium lacisediminis]
MSIILNIETATKNCSVALAKDGITIACKEIAEQNFSHAEKLHVFIEELLSESNLKFSDLSAIAVSQGPGSYTGLRIGVSSAKGLCYALNIPMIAIDTLQLLAKQIQIEDGIIIPMIDARRMEVFTAFYDKNHNQIRNTQAEIIDETSYQEITETIHLVGDGTEKFKNTLTDVKFVFHSDVVFPSANEMSHLSFDKYQKCDFVDVAYFEPYYLKDFVLSK